MDTILTDPERELGGKEATPDLFKDTAETGDTPPMTIDHDDPDEESLFVEQTRESSATIDDSSGTVVKVEEDEQELALLAVEMYNTQEPAYNLRNSNVTYAKFGMEDDDRTGMYKPPSDYGQSDEEVQKSLGDRTLDELSASKDELTSVAPRSRAKGVRAKTAQDWHERENQKNARIREKKRKILHRKPTGPNKRHKKERLTVVDEEGRKPRSDKVALQQALGNLRYSHPMHARMGHGPSIQSSCEKKSTVIISKKAYGEQAIREADCDKETAKKDWQKLGQAARQLGLNKCRPTNDNKWVLVSIQHPLYHHQMLGISWMVGRELNSDVRGGINGDEMGLGKTIQALGTIASHAPEAKDIKDGKRATLIVVPSSLVRQWKAEIDLFLETSHRRSVHIFKSSDDKSLLDLSFFDIMYVYRGTTVLETNSLQNHYLQRGYAVES